LEIAAGTQLGPYTIVSLLGEGGMGQVYRGHDDRLDRAVAIKILPAHLSGRPDLRQRFEQEARSISKLSHPHICSIFDVGETGGTAWLVMELLEGETLADRISRGPLPTQQVLRFGREIAEALEAAHRQHIVHRDLKPGNIMLTKSGVKLLDFGLAKIIQSPSFSDLSAPSTVQKPLTAAGTVLGTLQYMAPEQLEAREIDARTDIFALGAVLYEMVTGRRAFSGSSQSAVIAAILQSDPPPIAETQPLSPLSLERVIRPCLAKDPDERWQTAGDVALQLKGLVGATSAESSVQPINREKPLSWRHLIPWILLTVAAAAAVTGAYLASRKSTASGHLFHLSVILPDDQSLIIQRGGVLSISRDGSRILYLASVQGIRRLYVRALDSSEAIPLRETEGAESGFFSPDGNSVAILAPGKLRVLPLSGGSVAELCPIPGPRLGGTWLDNGSMVIAGPPGKGLEIVKRGAHRAETLTTVATDEAGHVFPEVLPGDRFVLFVAEIDGKSFDEARICELDLQTGRTRTLIAGGTSPVYAGSGRLFFVRESRLLSTKIDVGTGAIEGPVSEVTRPVLTYAGNGASFYGVSRDGTIVYVPYTDAVVKSRLVWVDESGKSQPLPIEAREYLMPRLSSDAARLLVQVTGANDDLWLYDLTRGSRSRLTFSSENMFPVWGADGSSLLFCRYGANSPSIFKSRSDGTGEPEKLLGADVGVFPSSVSRDGKTLAFTRVTEASGWDIGILPLIGDHKPRILIDTRFNEFNPEISPDGRWLAYVSDQSGVEEVYVQPIDGTGSRIQISANGGAEPAWSHSGTRLFYRSANGLMSVAISMTGELAPGTPAMLFADHFERGPVLEMRNYDVGPDDHRFLFVEHDPTQPRDLRRIDVLLSH